MRAHTIRLFLLAVLATALGGCDDGPSRTDGADGPAADPRGPMPAAAYERRLVFLGSGEPPTAVVFDFLALAEGESIDRGARVYLAADGEWDELLEERWRMAPMRDPWRIVPHEELDVVVTDAGEVGALVVDGDPSIRVEPGTVVDESSPGGGTQLVLRRARLYRDVEGGVMTEGVLLDAQLSRPLDQPGASAPRPSPEIEGFLAHGDGYHVVLTRSTGGVIGWVSEDGVGRVLRGLALEPVAAPEGGTGTDSAGTDAPAREWSIRGASGELAGRVRAELADRSALDGDGAPTDAAYVLVAGWVEDDGVRRDVRGLLRHTR